MLVTVSFAFTACSNPEPNDILPDKDVNVVIDLGLPLYQNLQVPTGWAFTPNTSEYGISGILIYNRNGTYVAYDRACPHYAPNDCTPMTFDGLYLKCTCDNTTFNILNGGTSNSPNVPQQAREYHVEILNANTLRIRNY